MKKERVNYNYIEHNNGIVEFSARLNPSTLNGAVLIASVLFSIIVCVIYINSNLFSMLLVLCFGSIDRTIEENVILIPSFGLQIKISEISYKQLIYKTIRPNVTFQKIHSTTKFIDISSVDSVFIHEYIAGSAVHYGIAIRLKLFEQMSMPSRSRNVSGDFTSYNNRQPDGLIGKLNLTVGDFGNTGLTHRKIENAHMNTNGSVDKNGLTSDQSDHPRPWYYSLAEGTQLLLLFGRIRLPFEDLKNICDKLTVDCQNSQELNLNRE